MTRRFKTGAVVAIILLAAYIIATEVSHASKIRAADKCAPIEDVREWAECYHDRFSAEGIVYWIDSMRNADA